MANYQIWGFSTITGNRWRKRVKRHWQGLESEFEIPCFNASRSIRKANGKCYTMRYPKIQELTDSQKSAIEDYCGYAPSAGEYGVIACTFGEVNECSLGLYRGHVTIPTTSRKRTGRDLECEHDCVIFLFGWWDSAKWLISLAVSLL